MSKSLLTDFTMSKKKIRGRCRLCQLDDWLIDSDIIPKFYYKPLKQIDGRFYPLSTDTSKKVIPTQKTITENLLCAQCDNVRLSRYEGHLRKVLFGGHPLSLRSDGPLLIIEGYIYKQIKNGLLSILWRMSISTDPFFSNVNLRDQEEERLREMLLNDIEIPEDEYPILVVAPYFDGSNLSDFISEPDVTLLDGNIAYRCLISGLIFTFFVGSAPLENVTQSLVLRSKRWPILKLRIEDIPFLYKIVIQHGWANAVRTK